MGLKCGKGKSALLILTVILYITVNIRLISKSYNQ